MTTISPTDTASRLSPKTFHRFAALTEMVTWSLLIIGMVLKYSGTTDAVMPFAGGIHGFGFLTFAAITTLLWINNRWSLGQGIVGLGVSIIPFAAWPFTLWADRKGLLEGGWRFADATGKPRNLPEKLLAQFVRHPARSIVGLLIAIAVVFTALLLIGQPYDPDAIADRVN
jgi:integral membrane protein